MDTRRMMCSTYVEHDVCFAHDVRLRRMMCASTAHGWNTSHHFAVKPQSIIMAVAYIICPKGKHHST